MKNKSFGKWVAENHILLESVQHLIAESLFSKFVPISINPFLCILFFR